MSDQSQTAEERLQLILESSSLEGDDITFLEQMLITPEEVRKKEQYRREFEKTETLLATTQQERDDALAAKEDALREKAEALEDARIMTRRLEDELFSLRESQKSDKEFIEADKAWRQKLTQEVTDLRKFFLTSQGSMKSMADVVNKANSAQNNLAKRVDAIVAIGAPAIDPGLFVTKDWAPGSRLRHAVTPIDRDPPSDASSATPVVPPRNEGLPNQDSNPWDQETPTSTQRSTEGLKDSPIRPVSMAGVFSRPLRPPPVVKHPQPASLAYQRANHTSHSQHLSPGYQGESTSFFSPPPPFTDNRSATTSIPIGSGNTSKTYRKIVREPTRPRETGPNNVAPPPLTVAATAIPIRIKTKGQLALGDAPTRPERARALLGATKVTRVDVRSIQNLEGILKRKANTPVEPLPGAGAAKKSKASNGSSKPRKNG